MLQFLVLTVCLILLPLVSQGQVLTSQYRVTYFDIPDPFAVPGKTVFESINEAGDIAGQWTTIESGPASFLLKQGGPSSPITCAKDAFRTMVAGINNKQEAVGTCLTIQGTERGFLRRSNGTISLVDFPGGAAATQALDINDNHLVVGWFNDPVSGRKRGFYLVNGKYTVLDPPDTPHPDKGAVMTAVNNQSTVVGYVSSLTDIQGVQRLSGGIWSLVQYPGASSTIPQDVNTHGHIVGIYEDDTGIHSFIKDAQGFRPFTVTLPGAILTQLTGLNDQGTLLGRVALPTGNPDAPWYWHGFVALPQAGPAPAGQRTVARASLFQAEEVAAPPSTPVRLVQGEQACAGTAIEAGGKLPAGWHFCIE